MDKKLFFDGKMFDAYNYMGAHAVEGGVRFCTFAPNAVKVGIVGDFNGWQEQEMQKEDGGFHAVTIPQAGYGHLYKYRIHTEAGACVEHTDPYAFQMELRPGCCAIVADLHSYRFTDDAWMKKRSINLHKPVNIYELHLGSWRTKESNETAQNAGTSSATSEAAHTIKDASTNEATSSEATVSEAGTSPAWYSYDEIAELLIPYLKENHYTHVEFMPLMEHPFDGSWGYQTTGFFAPTSRYGRPEQLMRLIDRLHGAGIGAILDIVPVHFARDAYGLANYDGTALYEYPHGDVTESEWGSYNFIYSRREAQCFMQSAAAFWLEKYHFDGLRMDAVSRLIYWHGDEDRGVNPNSLGFLKQMNAGLRKRYPGAMLIAEDSTTYPLVTTPVEHGGLGFDYKWSLGWMHDTLEYFQTSPEYRPRDYNKLTFAMSYFHRERYMLQFSHDENVHGKATILQKMHGEYEQKFPQGRALYMFMIMHPGKKLNFMGNEFGQLREWDEDRQQDWFMLKYPLHDSFHKYNIELNRIYTTYTELHDDYADGFRWLDCEQDGSCMYAMARKSQTHTIAVILNLSDADEVYRLAIPGVNTRSLRLLLHTDWEQYSGNTPKSKKTWLYDTKTATLHVDVPAFSGMMFRYANL